MLISPRYDGPPILTIDGGPTDLLEPTRRQRRRLESRLGDLAPTDWAAPSRCDAWTVQDVVAHLVGVNDFWTLSARAGLDGVPTRILTAFDPAATPEVMVGSMRDLSAEEVRDRFAASNDALFDVLASLDREGWSTIVETPAGHVPVRLLAHHALWDAWVHERDILLPLGAEPDREDDEVYASLRYAAAVSPALALGAGVASSGMFAVRATAPDRSFTIEVNDAVTVNDGDAPAGTPYLVGDAVDLLEALSIRAPLPPGTPPEWRAVLSGLATAFDTAIA